MKKNINLEVLGISVIIVAAIIILFLTYLILINDECYTISTFNEKSFEYDSTQVYGTLPMEGMFTYKDVIISIKKGCETN
jgi:uncharacterized membrane protein